MLQAGAGRDPGEQLEQAVGDVLKQAAAAAGGGSAVWALFAEYYAALGFHTSAREALLKQVGCACTCRKVIILMPVQACRCSVRLGGARLHFLCVP